MSRRHTTRALAVLATVIFALALAACGDDDDDGGGQRRQRRREGGSIALLLPESKTARYESQDRPLFEQHLKAGVADCELIYSNADQDPAKQQQQAEAALTKGADVMVLDPVDAASAAAIVTKAKQQDVPVISYDRLVNDADLDYYISFDSEKVGQLQAQSLVDALKETRADIVMINGAPTDNNAKLFKQGAHSVIDKSGVKVAKEYDTPDWSPDKAQQEMEQAITALGKDGFQGVYAANDGTAGGAIAAMKGNGDRPLDPRPPVRTPRLAGIPARSCRRPVRGHLQAGQAGGGGGRRARRRAAAGRGAPGRPVNDETDNGNEEGPLRADHSVVA